MDYKTQNFNEMFFFQNSLITYLLVAISERPHLNLFFHFLSNRSLIEHINSHAQVTYDNIIVKNVLYSDSTLFVETSKLVK